MKKKKKEKENLRGERMVISLSNLSKSYATKEKEIKVLSNINVDFYSGTFYAIMGHSGSGKSTLINILGLLDIPSSGKYTLFGSDIKKHNDYELSSMRMKNFGFIFQNYYLNNNLKAYENIMLPMVINKSINVHSRKEKAISLLEQLGLKNRIEHFPTKLSGGEQQRVAIARALANDPDIILADEPTGNLDIETEKVIFELLKKLSRNGKCVIVVSHSEQVKKYADYVYTIENNSLVGDSWE